MYKYIITLSTLGIFDLYFLLLHAVENINSDPAKAKNDFTPEGLIKIQSLEKQLSNELLREVKLGQHRK